MLITYIMSVMGEAAGSRKEEVGREIGGTVSGAGDLCSTVSCLSRAPRHHSPLLYVTVNATMAQLCISISVNVFLHAIFWT